MSVKAMTVVLCAGLVSFYVFLFSTIKFGFCVMAGKQGTMVWRGKDSKSWNHGREEDGEVGGQARYGTKPGNDIIFMYFSVNFFHSYRKSKGN